MSMLTPRRSQIGPWSELEGLQDRLNRIFGLPMARVTEEPMQWIPAVNLVEANGEFVLTAELPGMDPDEVEVDIEQDVLVLRGEKKTEKEEKGEDGRWYLRERSYGAFHRSFALPRSVEPTKIKAAFEDGVLTVHLPKRKEATARKIEISAP